MKTSVLFLILLFPFLTFAQHQPARVELVASDYLEGQKRTDGTTAQKVYKGVFRHEKTLLTADSAYFFSQQNTFEAFGQVHIIQGDSLDIYADYLHYNGNERLATLQNHIRLIDKEAVLTTDFLTYNLLSKEGHYQQGGKLVNKQNTLTSEHGYYHVKTHEISFKNEVLIVSPEVRIKSDTLQYNTLSKIAWFYGPTKIFGKDDTLYTENGYYDTKFDRAKFGKKNLYIQQSQTLTGDSLFYDKKKGYGKALKHIVFRDTLNKLTIKGNVGIYDKKSAKVMVTDAAHCIFETVDGNTKRDTIWFAADTIYSRELTFFKSTSTTTPIVNEYLHTTTPSVNTATIIEKSSAIVPMDTIRYRQISAYHHAKLFKSDLQAKADSMIFSYLDTSIRCFNHPIIWSQQNQLNADTIAVFLKNKKLYRIHLLNNAFIVSPETVSVCFNQIKGRNVMGWFVDNKLKTMLVTGNAESVYYAKDKSEIVGLNKSSSGAIRLIFGNNQLQSVVSIKNPEMAFIPIDVATDEDKILQGFIWKPQGRPQSALDVIPMSSVASKTVQLGIKKPTKKIKKYREKHR